MSLITEQGRQEQQRLDEIVARLSDDVLAAIGDSEVSPATVLSRESDQSPDLVREAIWKLLDERKVEFTLGRQLRRKLT